jgi:O-antigen/teichoic acid export membrane protein
MTNGATNEAGDGAQDAIRSEPGRFVPPRSRGRELWRRLRLEERVRSGKTVWVIGAGLVVTALNVVGGVVIARTLGPAGRGAVAGAVVVTQVAVWFATVGMARGNTYYLNDAAGGAKGSTLLSNSLLYSSVAGLVTGGVAAVSLGGIAPDISAKTVVVLLGTTMLAADFVNNLLLGAHDYRGYGAKRIAETFAYVLLLGGLAAGRWISSTRALAALLVAGLAANLFGLARLRVNGFILGARPERTLFWRVASFGARAQVSDVPRFLAQFIPQLIVLPLLGVEQFGLYTVALSYAGLTQLVSGPTSSVFLAEVAGRPIAEIAGAARAALRHVAVVIGGLTVALVVCAGWVILTLYGESFRPSVALARVLACWFLIGGLNQLAQHAFIAAGRPLRAAAASTVGMGLTVAGIAFVRATYGGLGVAFACVAGGAAELVLLMAGLGLVSGTGGRSK